MKTEQEILDMIKHFEGHAKDPEESLEQQIRYHGMAEAFHAVIDKGIKSEQEIKDMIAKCNNQAMINALEMTLE